MDLRELCRYYTEPFDDALTFSRNIDSANLTLGNSNPGIHLCSILTECLALKKTQWPCVSDHLPHDLPECSSLIGPAEVADHCCHY